MNPDVPSWEYVFDEIPETIDDRLDLVGRAPSIEFDNVMQEWSNRLMGELEKAIPEP